MNKNAIRILSVVLALIFWFLIINKENPIMDMKYNVSITILNESLIKQRKLHVVEEYSRMVEVTARGRKKDLEKVAGEDFIVRVDIKDYAKEGTWSVDLTDIQYMGTENITYQITGKNRLDLYLESISAKEVPIEYEAHGTPYEGYSISSVEMIPEKITLENLTSSVEKVAFAKVDINIDRLNSDKTFKETVKIYDAEGNELDILSESMTVDVKVTMRKEVDLVLRYTGQPAYDYYLDEDDISWLPLKGYVIGFKEVMESYNVIYTEPVDLTGRTATFEGQIQFKAPEGLRLIGATSANVRIGIKPYEYRTIEIQRDDIYVNRIYIDNNLEWTIRSSTVSMVVKGKASDMANIGNVDFSPHITLPIRDGDYQLPLQVTLPEGLTLVSSGIVDLHIDMKKKITVTQDDIRLVNKNEETYDYVLNDVRATITLYGPSEALDSITEENLDLYVDVENLTTGVHRVAIRLNNAGIGEVELKSAPNAVVKITPRTEASSSQEGNTGENGS